MRQLLILSFTIILFSNCNNNKGWSTADQQKGLKMCIDEIAGKLETDVAKKYCSCVIDQAMKKYVSFEAAQNGTEADGTKIGQACVKQLGLKTGGGGEEVMEEGGENKGGLFGGGEEEGGGKKKIIDEDETGGGGGWSRADKNAFVTPCAETLTQGGYSAAQSRQLCNCMLGKLEKKYRSLQDANDRGGEAAGAKVRQECEGGGDNDDN